MVKRIIKKKTIRAEEKQNLIDVSHISGLKIVPIETRKFVQYDLDFIADQNIQLPDVIEDEIKDAIVKVNIRVRQTELHKLDIRNFEDKIRQHAFYLKPIVPVIHKEHRVRIRSMQKDQAPIDAVKSWLINKNVKNAGKILEAAEKIIRGDEIES